MLHLAEVYEILSKRNGDKPIETLIYHWYDYRVLGAPLWVVGDTIGANIADNGRKRVQQQISWLIFMESEH